MMKKVGKNQKRTGLPKKAVKNVGGKAFPKSKHCNKRKGVT